MIGAIDPGKTTGVALFRHGSSMPAVTSFKDPTLEDRRALCSWLARSARQLGEPCVLVIEDQHAELHMVRDKKTGRERPTIDLPSLLKLARSAERWAVVGEQHGLEVEWVQSRTWQNRMLAQIPTKEAGKTLNSKQRAKRAVAATWAEVNRFADVPTHDGMKATKVERLNEHIRDAMLLGLWRVLYGDTKCR